SRISHLLAGTKVTVRCGTGGMAAWWCSLSAGKDISATTSRTGAAPGAAATGPRLLLEDPTEGALHLSPHRQAEGGEQGLGGQRRDQTEALGASLHRGVHALEPEQAQQLVALEDLRLLLLPR